MAQLLVLLAVIPGLVLVVYLYRKDVLEPEPKGLVGGAVAAGALAAGLALVVSPMVGIQPNAHGGDVFSVGWLTVRIGLVEEGAKLLLAVLLFLPKKEFNEPMDGIVYVGAVALGFAILENVGYVLMGGVGAALLRAVTAVPMHAFASAIAGYFLGLAKRKGAAGVPLVLVGWLVAAAIHAAYDFFAFYFRPNPLVGLGLCMLVVLLTWGLLKALIRSALKASPFGAMKHNFRVLANHGKGDYDFQCQLCGTKFRGRLAGRIVCPNDSCLNYYDWGTRI